MEWTGTEALLHGSDFVPDSADPRVWPGSPSKGWHGLTQAHPGMPVRGPLTQLAGDVLWGVSACLSSTAPLGVSISLVRVEENPFASSWLEQCCRLLGLNLESPNLSLVRLDGLWHSADSSVYVGKRAYATMESSCGRSTGLDDVWRALRRVCIESWCISTELKGPLEESVRMAYLDGWAQDHS
eukprot:1997684-Amphidinium_carterae.1